MNASSKSDSGIQSSELSLGFSPCPNDTFIFDALVHNKINAEGLHFDYVLHDVEELNRKALLAELDITKISFFAYASVYKNYQLLDSGSAMGFGCGPLLISKNRLSADEISTKKIAVPGIHTTANFLMGFAFPDSLNKTSVLFSTIEDAVLKGDFDAGVVIHENRFTYAKKGLHKIADLGEIWEQKTGMPIPLGGIAVRRSLPMELKMKIETALRKSVEYALQNPTILSEFVCKNAQSMDQNVMLKHINLYVNNFSKSLGKEGKAAIQFLYNKAFELKLIKIIPEDIFV